MFPKWEQWMRAMLVYLGGSITGQTYDGATGWREYVSRELFSHGIKSLDPMRGKAYLSKEEMIADSYTEVMATIKGITTRDRFDCTRADLVLFNFEGAEHVSVGSCIEVGWADAARIPIVVVMSEGNPHWHGMIRECAGFIVPTLDAAIDVIARILGR
jgi:hypothetical protein